MSNENEYKKSNEAITKYFVYTYKGGFFVPLLSDCHECGGCDGGGSLSLWTGERDLDAKPAEGLCLQVVRRMQGAAPGPYQSTNTYPRCTTQASAIVVMMAATHSYLLQRASAQRIRLPFEEVKEIGSCGIRTKSFTTY